MRIPEGDRTYERFEENPLPKILDRGMDLKRVEDLLERRPEAGSKNWRKPERGSGIVIKPEIRETGTVTYRLDEDMLTVVSVETPSDFRFNIIIKPVADAESALGQVLLGTPPPAFSAK